MDALTLLIVDDEPPARKKLRSFLEEEKGAGEWRILEAGNGIDAARMIREEKPDIVFLDIQMPGMTGFEVIDVVGTVNMPAVVFVTAYDQYAIEAFDVQAVDYLLKPFHNERFRKAFQRAQEKLNSGTASEEVNRIMEHVGKSAAPPDRIMVKKGQRYFFVKTSDIIHISAEEKYVRIHTATESYLMRDSMIRMEKRLDSARFIRIHRSSIVNIDHIKEVQPWTHGDYVVILKEGTKLNLSRRYSDRLLQTF